MQINVRVGGDGGGSECIVDNIIISLVLFVFFFSMVNP